jgi:hypothetical protein
MNRNWKRFARSTQVVIGAFRVHAFESVTVNGLLAAITSSIMHLMRRNTGTNVIFWPLDSGETMKGMLLVGDSEAGRASVEIRALETFIAVTLDPRVTEVTGGVMNNQSGCSRRLSRGRSSARRFSSSFPFPIPTEYSVHDDLSRFVYIEELVERIMGMRSSSRNAGRAQIIVCTIEALVTNALDCVATHITNDSPVNDLFWFWR